MFTRGEFTTGDVTYGVLMNYTKSHMEILLINCGTVVSAYKTDGTGSYSYNNSRAKELGLLIKRGVKSCTSKNNTPMPFELGAMNSHEFTKVKVEYSIQLYMGEVVGASIRSDKQRVELEYIKEAQFPENIPYIKLTEIKKDFTNVTDTEEEVVQVRSVQEIALEKEDVSWLKNKKYYIVNDDATAEQLFSFLDKYNGVIAYDTETTGLHINMFGEIGSDKKKELERYNAANPENQIRADRLVGIIFCVENDVSYYFPCFNRKFDNLYQNLDSPVRKTTVNNIKARYTVGDLRNDDSFMANYIRTTPDSEWGSDVILMERCRDILHTKHLVAHNGTFEWKVGWLYHIDTNISDDTMIMHQLMYKFRSTTSNRGEKSSLKFLAKKELGVDQWELDDFFPNWKEDDAGTVRTKAGAKKKKGSKIDFSYMTYEGTRVYAPTDGDVTFQLFNKYKKDMVENHKEIEYLYSVELIVSCAIAYMEFYGHRIDETKILNAREETKADLIMIESEIRQTVGYSDQKEFDKYNELKNVRNEIELLENKKDEQSKTRSRQLRETIPALTEEVKKAIAENTNNVLNLSAPGQVADLFYNKLGYPTTLSEGKMSVAKKVYKGLMKEKDENGKPKYPVAGMYAKYKDKDTQLTKFFDNLPYFMYPGGFIFSSYGQISTATGRMSCIDEDALISVVGGYKKIKDIEVGDMVYCYDNDGNIAIRKVLNKLDKGIKDCIELTWQSQGTHEFGSLVCTPDHKILSKDNGWVRADKVSLCYNHHKIVDKRSVGKRHVYDLEVEEFHNFIANEICVHNCSKPNAQQYPKLITKIVIPRDGFVMLDADYSQIEYRVLTALAGNTELAELFSDPDSDYHTLMASLMYDVPYSSVTSPMRSAAKSFNFGIPYGMGLGSLAILLTGKNTPQTRDEAAEKYEAYFKNQPRTRKFFDNVKELAQVYGYTETQFKRRRYYSFKEPDGTINEAKKARALRQAGNAVIQGSAADVFKIGVARNFSYIRRNNLLGKLLIINMIHDEQLMEIDAQHLNVQRILADVGKNMQFHLDGYPPLYIGAGIGKAWGYAKGKMAEIHPVLLQQLTDEAKSIPIYREDCSTYVDPHTVLDYFENRVYEFRRKKVADYLGNPENWHKNIHPAIGGLINLQFNYGRGDEAKAYTAPDGTKYTDQQFLELNIGDFLKENHIDAQPDWFRANETTIDEKSEADADVEYSDDEEEDDVADIDYSADAQVFSCIDESNKLFGSSVQDLIATFGACILPGQHICGLDVRNIYFKKLDALIDFLTGYLCDPDDEGALQIVFLNNANILKYTGQYVKGIRASEFETEYKTLMAKKHFDTEWEKNQGDINNRAQAE